MVDTGDLKSPARKGVRVQVPPEALFLFIGMFSKLPNLMYM